MKVKDLPIFCAYLGFLLALIGLKEEFALWWGGVFLVLFFSLVNHFKWKLYLPGRIYTILTISLIIICFFVPREDIFDLSLYLLFILSLIRFLSPFKPRDLWQVYTLNLFLICSATFSNFDLNFGVILILFCWVTLVGLCFLNAQYCVEVASIQKPLFNFASGLSLGVVFLAVFFFLLLPRSPYTFFLGFGFSFKGKLGFTDNIDLTSIQEIIEDTSVAFRAIMPSSLKSPPYWRGIVFDTYESGHWRMTIKTKDKEKTPSCPCANIYEQTIFIEPYEGRILFGLESPFKIEIIAPRPISISPLPNLSFVRSRPVYQRLEYKALSCPIFPLPSLKDQERTLYLQIPQALKRPLKELFYNLVSKDDPPALAVKKLSQFLKNPPFRYERRIKQTKEEPVLNFLFTTHQGWCEHFVSALALLLRSGGIPARVVGGYYGGSWNERGHYYLVKQKEAHAWVEYWDGNTWQRTDPTPISEKTLYFHFLSKWLDYLRLRWYAYVINYDFSKQKEFFQQLRDYVKPDKSWYKIKKPTTFPWDSLRRSLLYLIVFGWVLIIIYLFFKRKRINPFLRLCKLLSHYGYTTLPSQGGLEIADMLGQKDYKIASLVKEFVYVWYPIRYGKEIRDKKTLKYLNTLLDQIKSYLRTQRHLSIK